MVYNSSSARMGCPFSKFHTLCNHEPRTAEFIPPQRRHVQEHRNRSNAFANTTLKRHECRAPFARFMSNPLSKKNHTLCAHESPPGRAVLPHSLNAIAPRQRRLSYIATWLLGNAVENGFSRHYRLASHLGVHKRAYYSAGLSPLNGINPVLCLSKL